ncbi:MAG: hypothetical protein ABI870_01425 [Rhodanobacter sp.]
MNLEISQEVFDRLMIESIGVADISADKLIDRVPSTMPHICFTTTTVHTHGTC